MVAPLFWILHQGQPIPLVKPPVLRGTPDLFVMAVYTTQLHRNVCSWWVSLTNLPVLPSDEAKKGETNKWREG